MSLYAKLVAALIVAVALGALWHRIDQGGYKRAQREYEARAELQREANRGRTRQAEEKHAAQTIVRERFIVTTVKEIVHDTENLSACVLTPAARQRLHDAARCASEDRPSACSSGNPVR